jgi:hypothetical protein
MPLPSRAQQVFLVGGIVALAAGLAHLLNRRKRPSRARSETLELGELDELTPEELHALSMLEETR